MNSKTAGKPAAICIVLLLIAFAACEQPAGRYTPPSLRIGSVADLARIGADPDWPLDGDYTLNADLELRDWKPIGSPGSPFAGTFEGGGHTITITNFSADTAQPYFGLFGYLKNATVSRVNLAGTIKTTWNSDTVKALYAGGIAAYVDSSRISECSSTALIDSESEKGSVYTGGIAGYGLESIIAFCHASGTVRARGRGHNSSAGGIGGYGRKTLIADCSARGDVDLRAVPPEGAAAQDYLYMIYAGGLAGYTGDGSRVERSYAEGAVYAASPYPYAGGLTGYNYGDLSGNAEGSVIAECYATGRVSAEALINGIAYAGGLAGYTSQKGALQDSYATGAVEALSGGRLAWAGGIAGSCANRGSISRCYARGSVSATTGAGDLPFGGQPGISDGALAGGIAGYVYWDSSVIVENCVALNPSVAASGGGIPWGVHRIAGRKDPYARLRSNAALEGMACVSDPAGDPGPEGLDGAGISLPLARAVFADLGWDFETTWNMDGDGYPALQWEPRLSAN
jgi:hypothetical protein